jgi:peptide/nickel transport system ATP-binding protein
MSESIVSIRNLATHYPITGGWFEPNHIVHALDNIDLEIKRGQFFGLVGESGSGKTTLGRAILKVAPISAGEIIFDDGEREFDIKNLTTSEELAFRRQAQLIFQDPYAALSPRMTVRDIIAEPLEVMKLTSSVDETNQRVRDIASECRLNVEHLRRFPHAFSGGQRQRISIARALVANPSFIVADESVAALDVSIQADILNLLKSLQQQHGLTFLFISHDLSVVAHVCDVVAVMYLGRIVEMAPSKKLFAKQRHPYTAALLSAIPSINLDHKHKAIKLKGEIPSPLSPPSGCRFHTRCAYARDRCEAQIPQWRAIDEQHFVACHFTEELDL